MTNSVYAMQCLSKNFNSVVSHRHKGDYELNAIQKCTGDIKFIFELKSFGNLKQIVNVCAFHLGEVAQAEDPCSSHEITERER